MTSHNLLYIHTIHSVLLPYMYMEIPIDSIKRYYMYKERRAGVLSLGIMYQRKRYPAMYGCTATIVTYDTDRNTATILGLERFQKVYSVYGHVNRIRYVFDRNVSTEHIWVKQLKIIECLERIAEDYEIKINLQKTKNIRPSEFSFTIAASGFFNAREKYRLLSTHNVAQRFDLEYALLNSRFLVRK